MSNTSRGRTGQSVARRTSGRCSTRPARLSPYQLQETEAALSPAQTAHRRRLLFRAKVPAMGYRVYRYAPDQEQTAADRRRPCRATRASERSAARAARSGHRQHHLLRRQSDRASNWLAPAAGTCPRCWRTRATRGPTACPATAMHGRFFADPQFTVCENGPLQASILVERRHEHSVWLQQITAAPGRARDRDPQLAQLAGQVATAEAGLRRGHRRDRHAVHDIPFGWIERPANGNEVPTQMWMDVSGPAEHERADARRGVAQRRQVRLRRDRTAPCA